MAYRKGPPPILLPTGPNCEGCPYRSISFGFAPGVGDLRSANFMFVLEALGRDEVEQGRPAVGGTGRIFARLLYDNTGIRRSQEYVTNVVKCRPIVWQVCEACSGKGYFDEGLTSQFNGGNEPGPTLVCGDCAGRGQVPARLQNGDYVNNKPDPRQSAECARRYLDREVKEFGGKTYVALGEVPLHYFGGRSRSIRNYRGTVLESGQLVECLVCSSTGAVNGPSKRCGNCKGKGQCYQWEVVQNEAICDKHRSEPNRRCRNCRLSHSGPCPKCGGTGSIPGRQKACKDCSGVGRIPAEPNNPHVTDRIPAGKRVFITYHPAYLMRNSGAWPVVARDFGRLEHLDEDIKAEISGTDYALYPPNLRESAAYWNEPVSVDIEGPSAETYEGPITVIGFSPRPGRAFATDIGDPAVRHVLDRGQIIGQNYLLYDAWVLTHREGFPKPKWLWDTRGAGHLLNPDTPHDIGYMAGEYAEPPVHGYWKARAEGKYKAGDDKVVCQDADITYRIKVGQEKRLEEAGLLGFMLNEVIPVSLMSLDLRLKGMRIDLPRMQEAAGRVQAHLELRRQELPDWGGCRTENQHAKVQKYLYQTLHLPVILHRKTKNPTAAEEALLELKYRIETGHKSVGRTSGPEQAEALRLIDLLLHCRGLSKLGSSFLSYRDEWIHPQWNPFGTSTFRYSCFEPNVMQVPDCSCDQQCGGSNPLCLGARYVFLPDEPGWEILSADLKQAEIVGFLWWAQEWNILKRVLLEGWDAHFAVASAVYNREPTKAERDDTKTTTFAILFGEQDVTTAARLHRSIEDIRDVRSRYFSMLPGVSIYRDEVVQELLRNNYVETPFGLRRHIRLVRENDHHAINQACNAKIQNIPPIVTRRAMLELQRVLPQPARLLGQVHDEILVTYPRELRKEVCQAVYEVLHQQIPEMPAPALGMAGGLRFNVDLAVGSNWGSLQEYKI